MRLNGTVDVYGQTFDGNTLKVLKELVHNKGYRRISICAAYASYKGVVEIRAMMPIGSEFRWVIGLDDAFTEPNALEAAYRTHNSQVRTSPARSSRAKPLFHPKIFLADKNDGLESSLLIGSSNLTYSGLTSNFEAFSVCNVSPADVKRVEHYWSRFWSHAADFEFASLDGYREKYKKNFARNKQIADDVAGPPPSRRTVNESVRTATLIWTELGSMTGYSTEQVEIVKDLVPFLGIGSDYEANDEHEIRISTTIGTRDYQLMFKKGMWRFKDIQQGFVESLKEDDDNESPYILVIERQGKSRFRMSIIERDSNAARSLKAKSQKLDFKRTTGYREYGWL